MNYIKYKKSILHAAELMTKACAEANRKIHKEMNFEVSHEQYLIMETIMQMPGAIQTVIAKEILMQCSYVCQLLSKLEKLGLIERKQAIRGTRQIIYENYLTEEGIAVYKKIKKYYTEITPQFDKVYKQICKSIDSKYENLDINVITEILLKLTEKIISEHKLKF